VSEREETDGHDDPDHVADDDPPFDVVQAVSDFVATVIDEIDSDPPDTAGD
jgi:hypothetical protein